MEASGTPLQRAFVSSSDVFKSINPINVLSKCLSASLISNEEHEEIQAATTNTTRMRTLLGLIGKKKDSEIEKCLSIFASSGGQPDEVRKVQLLCALNTVRAEIEKIEFIDDVIEASVIDLSREEERRVREIIDRNERRKKVLDEFVPRNQDSFFSFLNAIDEQKSHAELVDRLEVLSKIDLYKHILDEEQREYCFARCGVTKVKHARTNAIYLRTECILHGFTDKEAQRAFKELQATQEKLKQTSQNYIKKVSLQGQILTILTECLDGDRLQKPPMKEFQVKVYIADIASALKEIHDLGAFHGNVKPRNVVRVKPNSSDKEWKTYILNIGIKEFLLHDKLRTHPELAYHAPEVVNKRTVSSESDVWSLGAIVYHLITGKNLCTGDTLIGQPKDCTTTFWDFIISMLAEDPSSRPTIDGVLSETQKKSPSQQESETLIDLNECYPMNSNPRGHILILNVTKVEGMDARSGSEEDSDAMSALGQTLHFRSPRTLGLTNPKNPTAEDICKAVNQFSKADHASHQCAIVVVMSHGIDGFVFGSDSQRVKIQKEIIKPIAECKTLSGKPKIFIFQCCRISDNQSISQTEALHSDILIVHATLQGEVAYRDESKGSLFIRKLTEVFKTHAATCHALDMMTRVNREVQELAEKEGVVQISPVNTTLKKSLYFNP